MHVPTLPWWQAWMRAERDCLYDWGVMLTHGEACPASLQEHRQRLADVLDACAQLEVLFEDAIPAEQVRQTFIESKEHP